MKNHYDVVVVGGGIVGAGLFRDLALHGLKVLLIERGDFSAQTSQGSSKMLHGGVRYLENLDFALVQEALEEKNLWLKLTPHLAESRQFHLPVFSQGRYPLRFIQLGLFLYDFLSHFQNQPSGVVTKSTLLKRFPSLNPDGLTGAGTYHDAIVDDHKLALECLWDGLYEAQDSQRTECLNYQELKALHRDARKLWHLNVFDHKEKKAWQCQAPVVLFATGPFTDHLFRELKLPWKPVLMTSKGVHLWLPKDALNLWGPLLLQTPDNRVVFVIPQREAILVGTTETPVQEDMFNIKTQQSDINYLLSVLEEFFPSQKITENHILSSFAAIRPLVRAEGVQDRGKTSRTHKIFRPADGLYTLLGGKYTTFRRMAQDLCREVVPQFGLTYRPQLTLQPLRVKSHFQTFPQFAWDGTPLEQILREEKVYTREDLVHRRMSLVSKNIPEILSIEIEKLKLS
jgi:glycerol-3-phosphate dehydrogenase